jgi:hypothetical protein
MKLTAAVPTARTQTAMETSAGHRRFQWLAALMPTDARTATTNGGIPMINAPELSPSWATTTQEARNTQNARVSASVNSHFDCRSDWLIALTSSPTYGIQVPPIQVQPCPRFLNHGDFLRVIAADVGGFVADTCRVRKPRSSIEIAESPVG